MRPTLDLSAALRALETGRPAPATSWAPAGTAGPGTTDAARPVQVTGPVPELAAAITAARAAAAMLPGARRRAIAALPAAPPRGPRSGHGGDTPPPQPPV